jgi:protein ImuB
VLSILATAEPGDRSEIQLGLFAPPMPEPMRLDITLARIAALVGEDRIGRATLVDTYRTESFHMERFSVASLTSCTKKFKSARQSVAIRRCRPPLRLFMQREGMHLTAFSMLGKRYTVQEAYGPWRKSGDWWSSEVWSREEWDVRATDKTGETLLGVTHDLLRHQWQLEALYD